MARNARLPHPHDVLQLGDGEFLLLEQEEQAQPGGIGHQAEEIYR